eukprot:8492836-Pyramimonas_sp.AAC.1
MERITTELSLWSGGCACHEHLRTKLSKCMWGSLASKLTEKLWHTCPMSGCRAPELAAGKLKD